jgi:hypothetical protein
VAAKRNRCAATCASRTAALGVVLANTQLFADYGPFGMMLMASPTLSEEGTLAVKGPSLGGALGLSAMSKPALVAPPHSVARPPLGETGMFVVSEAPNKATVSPSENTAIPELPVLIVVPSPRVRSKP